jgi:WD40 repeat protein
VTRIVQFHSVYGLRPAAGFAVFSVAFFPDGRRVASGGHDGAVRIWPVGHSGDPLVLRGHQGVVWSLAVSPDGRHVATSSNDGTLRVWDVTGGGRPVVFTGYEASVESVAFSPNGRQLLTTHDDGTVRVQDCVVCGPLTEVRALAAKMTSRTLTTDETRFFGLDR